MDTSTSPGMSFYMYAFDIHGTKMPSAVKMEFPKVLSSFENGILLFLRSFLYLLIMNFYLVPADEP